MRELHYQVIECDFSDVYHTYRYKSVKKALDHVALAMESGRSCEMWVHDPKGKVLLHVPQPYTEEEDHV